MYITYSLHIAHIFQQGLYTSSLYISVDRKYNSTEKNEGGKNEYKENENKKL